MTLTKQEVIPHWELQRQFEQVYKGRSEKAGLFNYAEPWSHWGVWACIDGPVTFFVMDINDKTYTGWSKFDNTGRYHEMNGIFRAIQKAVDKYLSALLTEHLEKILDKLPVVSTAKKVDPFEDADYHDHTPTKENPIELYTDEGTKQTG